MIIKINAAAALERAKTVALDQIDAQAEVERGRYLTSGSGQAMVYLAKQAEARAFLAGKASQAYASERSDWANEAPRAYASESQGTDVPPAPEAMETSFPHLEAEVGLTGQTVEEVARAVAAMEAAWAQISAAIEQTRLAAKNVVRLCSTPQEVTDTLAGITWPAPDGTA